ncbi:AraC family transcriptional regulator [Roseivivax halodurans JCM 10272]|uniref:AraC family transcriptional regulator n=1 Tax=Roseivivax halodurans JCM 10272 TaxID=1449350 RepID=X7EHL9_9RHOB|nr:response regulator [Roseivivax halodurans]ETX15599.1 AraC family transcriptional regulator [Roseivivax halodurans JCM 10272]
MPPSTGVLVVEDEPIIALDMSCELRLAGWGVVGPALSLDHARRLLLNEGFRVALLDVNVGDETSFDFARACRSEGIAVIFMTGYSRAILPEDLADSVLLRKPVQMSELRAALAG